VATPQRLRLLTAKVVVVAAAAFSFGLVVAGSSFVICQTIVGRGAHEWISDPVTIRRLMGAAGIFVAMALIGAAAGTITRHTAAGLVGLVAVLVLPRTLAGLLSSKNQQQVGQFLPLRVTDELVAAHRAAHTLQPLAALCVLAAEIAVLLATASWMLSRRDA
jgi:hypothetical protein